MYFTGITFCQYFKAALCMQQKTLLEFLIIDSNFKYSFKIKMMYLSNLTEDKKGNMSDSQYLLLLLASLKLQQSS